MMPDATEAVTATLAQRLEQNMPGLPKHIVGMIEQGAPGTCGRCSAYDKVKGAWCSMRDLIVQPNDPGCPIYDPVAQD